jgi:hypothetical protein
VRAFFAECLTIFEPFCFKAEFQHGRWPRSFRAAQAGLGSSSRDYTRSWIWNSSGSKGGGLAFPSRKSRPPFQMECRDRSAIRNLGSRHPALDVRRLRGSAGPIIAVAARDRSRSVPARPCSTCAFYAHFLPGA